MNGSHRFVIIGETGCGKSTFINTMTSFFLDGTLANPRICIPNKYYDSTENYDDSERDILDNSKAQTNEVTEYLFESKDGRRILQQIILMDTPGINDDRGLDQDDINLDKIIEGISNADFISGIILLINGTNARITSSVRSLFDRFGGVLPDYIMSNIIVVMTMCRRDTCNFTNFEALGFTPAIVFYMNNTAFSSDPAEWLDMDIMSCEWNKSMAVCNKIVNFGTRLTQLDTFQFRQMRTIRNNIKQSLHASRLKILNILKMKEEYEKAKIEAQKSENEALAFKNKIKTTTIVKKTLIPHTRHSTVCSVCTQICHFECGLTEVTDSKNSSKLIECSCINTATHNCNECRCSVEKHYHSRVKLAEETTTLEDAIETAKYNALINITQMKKNDVNRKLTEYNLIDASVRNEIDSLKISLHNDCKQMKKICKKFNVVAELHYEIVEIRREALNVTDISTREMYDEFINYLSLLANEMETLALTEVTKPKLKRFFFF